MDHFPVFMAVAGRRIVLSGGGDAALAALAHADGAKVNIVDNLADSQFITPAIVDRDPVVVAIGTEGAAPVLARKIKADLEESLPASLGVLARIGKTFRHAVEVLPMGAKRRDFWSGFYFKTGPQAIDTDGEAGVLPALEASLDKAIMTADKVGSVDLVGAGPGDPDLLTLKARKALDTADVVIHDRLVTSEILELARRVPDYSGDHCCVCCRCQYRPKPDKARPQFVCPVHHGPRHQRLRRP